MARQPTLAPGAPAFKAKLVGALIKQEREQNSWSQAEFARRAGLAKQVISNIERGSVVGNTLAAIAYALDLTMHDIINVGFAPLTHQEQVLETTVSSLLRKMKPENQQLALKQLNAIQSWQRDK